MASGIIHRSALERGLPQLRSFFRRGDREQRRDGHHLQLEETVPFNAPDFVQRSILGMTRMYNMLPRNVVETVNDEQFQARLQALLSQVDATGFLELHDIFSPMNNLRAFPVLRRVLRDLR